MKVVPASLAAAFAAIMMMSPAVSAEIKPIRGEILVNGGTGFRAIEGAVRLKTGDAAIAAPQALGRLTYEDGYTVEVVPGTAAWIGARSPCAAADGTDTTRDPTPVLKPRVVFDPAWLSEGAAMIDGRKPPAGP
jgi:hypothetical protein